MRRWVLILDKPFPTVISLISILSAAIVISQFLVGTVQANKSDLTTESLPQGVSADWLSSVQKGIQESEYHITWQTPTALADLPAAWQAPNRAQDLRIYFTASGIRTVPRTEKTPTWQWGQTLTGWGCEGAVQPASQAERHVQENRFEYRRGPVTEWYVNRKQGLEQGFTIASPPPGVGNHSGTPLVLELAVSGSLTPQLSPGGKEMTWRDSTGRPLIRYGKLAVSDALGRQLPAHIQPSDSGISIVVEADGAAYPVIVDPLIQGVSETSAWTAESDQAYASFGISVSTAGDVNGDGYSDVIVGASGYDNGESDEGRAYVFHGSASGLEANASWTAESDQANAHFGISVSTAGDVNGDGYSDVIVGAFYYDNGQADEGRAYVYHGSKSGLEAGAAWTAESDQANAWFGFSLSAAGDVNGDGYSDVIVGADHYDNGESDEGRAYVYHGSKSGLEPAAAWTAESDQADALFGVSVGTAGDVNGDNHSDVIVGAYLYDNGESDEGRAYVYHGSKAGLESTAAWTAESDQANAYFGVSVSTAGDVNGDGYSDVIVGAYYYANGEDEEGRAYVYHGSTSGLEATAAWTAESDQAYARLGRSVSTAGDVNSDGYSDVIVGARRYDNGETDAGRAYVYHGSKAGLEAAAAWTAGSDQAGANLGRSVSTAGDVNGDGYSDVIVGVHRFHNGESREGRAYVYHGSSGRD